MSVEASVGSERNLLDETPEHARQLVIANPILRDEELERLRQIDSDVFHAHTIDTTWPVADGPEGLELAVERICAEADEALAGGVNIIVLSDRGVGPERAPVPSLLAVSALHHHLVRAGTRLQAGLIVESGEPRSVQSVAVLVGYGAAAVNPYLMLETLADLVDLDLLPPGMTKDEAQRRATKGIAKGLLKTISKMGISTIPSYCGAQVFEAIGLSRELVDRHFTGTASRIGGIGIEALGPRHARPPRARLPGLAGRIAAGDRPLLVAARGRAPPVEPGDDRAAPARGAARRLRDVRGVRAARQRRLDAPLDAPRVDALPRGGGRRRADRGGRAREGDREALRHGRDVARLALPRGARDARGRDEQDRRALEHRRGR